MKEIVKFELYTSNNNPCTSPIINIFWRKISELLNKNQGLASIGASIGALKINLQF